MFSFFPWEFSFSTQIKLSGVGLGNANRKKIKCKLIWQCLNDAWVFVLFRRNIKNTCCLSLLLRMRSYVVFSTSDRRWWGKRERKEEAEFCDFGHWTCGFLAHWENQRKQRQQRKTNFDVQKVPKICGNNNLCKFERKLKVTSITNLLLCGGGPTNRFVHNAYTWKVHLNLLISPNNLRVINWKNQQTQERLCWLPKHDATKQRGQKVCVYGKKRLPIISEQDIAELLCVLVSH